MLRNGQNGRAFPIMLYHCHGSFPVIGFALTRSCIAMERVVEQFQLQFGRPFPLFHDRVYERPDSMPNPNPTIIAMFEHDSGLACEPDAGRSPGEDDGAGFEGGGLREEGNGLADVEDLVSVGERG